MYLDFPRRRQADEEAHEAHGHQYEPEVLVSYALVVEYGGRVAAHKHQWHEQYARVEVVVVNCLVYHIRPYRHLFFELGKCFCSSQVL